MNTLTIFLVNILTVTGLNYVFPVEVEVSGESRFSAMEAINRLMMTIFV